MQSFQKIFIIGVLLLTLSMSFAQTQAQVDLPSPSQINAIIEEAKANLDAAHKASEAFNQELAGIRKYSVANYQEDPNSLAAWSDSLYKVINNHMNDTANRLKPLCAQYAKIISLTSQVTNMKNIPQTLKSKLDNIKNTFKNIPQNIGNDFKTGFQDFFGGHVTHAFITCQEVHRYPKIVDLTEVTPESLRSCLEWCASTKEPLGVNGISQNCTSLNHTRKKDIGIDAIKLTPNSQSESILLEDTTKIDDLCKQVMND